MKSKLLFTMLAALIFTACEQKNAAIRDELRLIEKTSKDTTQTKYIRESAETFADILSGKQGIPVAKWSRAHWAMSCDRNPTVIATYVAFLKALEKRLPNELPELETYEAMKDKAGSAKLIDYNVGQTAIMMSNSIGNITLFGDPTADAEVDGVLRRLREKHGASQTGKKILEFLNMVHQQGVTERSGHGTKPWESPRRPEFYPPRSDY